MKLAVLLIFAVIYIHGEVNAMIPITARYDELASQNINGYSNITAIFNSLNLATFDGRGALLDVVASSLKFIEDGTNYILSQIAANGGTIDKRTEVFVNTIRIFFILVLVMKMVNDGYDVLDRWMNENQAPSVSKIVNLIVAILALGYVLYTFKTCSTIFEEAQIRTLQSYWNSLRSKHERKLFRKLNKKIMMLNMGNKSQGMAEVISAIRKMSKPHKAFKILMKNFLKIVNQWMQNYI